MKENPKPLQTISVLGHRIERLDILVDTTLSFDERKAKFLNETTEEVRELREKGRDKEMNELLLDATHVNDLPDDETVFRQLHEQLVEYYKQVKDLS